MQYAMMHNMPLALLPMRARRDAQSGADVERLEEEIETTDNVIPRRGRARGNGTRGRGTRGMKGVDV